MEKNYTNQAERKCTNNKKLIIYIALTAITLAVYWQINHYDFINFDDNIYVTQNLHIQSGMTLEGFRWAFGTKYFDLWTPLLWLSFMFDYQLHGLNAGGYHLTNLALHILSTLLLFWLFNRMTGALWKSAFVAAFFALHPLHVESVAWISERKDVLSAFFWMLTLCLYVYYTENPAINRYLLALFSFTCALMSKPMVITLPIIMILLDYWPLKRFCLKNENDLNIPAPKKYNLLLLWEKIPFFILATVLVIITFFTPDDRAISVKGYSLGSRLCNVPVSFMMYLEKTFIPHDMSIYYPFSEHLPLWQVLGATFVIIIISATVFVLAKRFPYLFAGWLWYSIALIPVIKIVQVGYDSMADRYHYLPSIGISVMLAWGIPHLFKYEERLKKILFSATIAYLTILAALTWRQCHYWENSITLFSHAVNVTKDNFLAHSNLGAALIKKGHFEDAVYHCTEAIRISPGNNIAIASYKNRGIAYAKQNKYGPAIDDFSKAIILTPDDAEIYNNRGFSYLKLGRHQPAIDDFSKAITLKPGYALYYYNRGLIYAATAQSQRALKDFNEAIRLKPDFTNLINEKIINKVK